MFRTLRNRREQGATGIEYGMLAALIAVVIITAVSLLGTSLSGVFSGVSSALGIAGGGTDDPPALVDRTCTDGVYTGDYSNWYWIQTDRYSHGQNYLFSTGEQWVGQTSVSNGRYTYEDRGVLRMTRTGNIGFTIDGVYTNATGTQMAFDKGSYYEPDPGNGWPASVWEGSGLPYLSTDKGTFQYIESVVGFAEPDSNGVQMATKPANSWASNYTYPCA